MGGELLGLGEPKQPTEQCEEIEKSDKHRRRT
jgi:hypothetical protein